MYSQRRSLGRKLVCDLRGERQEREAELRGGGSGARGVRGRAVRRRPLTPPTFVVMAALGEIGLG